MSTAAALWLASWFGPEVLPGFTVPTWAWVLAVIHDVGRMSK